jgi:hypothetical protein
MERTAQIINCTNNNIKVVCEEIMGILFYHITPWNYDAGNPEVMNSAFSLVMSNFKLQCHVVQRIISKDYERLSLDV